MCGGFVAKPMVMASWILGTGWARQAAAKGKSGIEGVRPFEGWAWKSPPMLVIFILSC